MIHCFLTLCLVASPHTCQAPVEIMPADGQILTSPMQCGRGGLTYFTQGRMAEQTPEWLEDGVPAATEWFAKTYGKQEGDDSGVIQAWLDEQKARAKRLEPQIK